MTKGKKKKDDRSRVSLRTDRAVYIRLGRVANALGLDVNGVMCYLLARWLPQLELEAEAYKAFGKTNKKHLLALQEEWKRKHPGRPKREFHTEYLKSLM